MIATLHIYRNDKSYRIETFDDEKISIVSSVQQINDISKIFTDFSQSFTIPATPTNNQIFSHWYDNSIDNGFDQRIRYDGYIEIDTQLFRRGRWQIEGVSVKDNKIENYKITFYGLLKSLFDKFGKEKLQQLSDVNDSTMTYNSANVIGRVATTTNYDLFFPLISSSRAWQNTGGGVGDITTLSGSIKYGELFPALRIKKIFDAIESRYGVTLQSTFFNSNRFKEAFLYLKNKETMSVYTELLPVNFTTATANTLFWESSVANDTIKYKLATYSPYNSAKLTMTVTTTGSYILYVYKNGSQVVTTNGTGTQTFTIFDESQGGAGSNVGTYSFAVQKQSLGSFTTSVEGSYKFSVTKINLTMTSPSQTPISNFDLTNYMPDMLVSDFVNGILKMFNLTAYSEYGVNYIFEQIEDWYSVGKIKDFSEYTLTDNEIERVKSFNKVNLTYQKCESILNRQFSDLFAREYGDLTYTFSNDGGEYSINLPFENLMFNRFGGTLLQVGYCLNKDLKPYQPKPIILYKLGNKTASFYIGTTAMTQYNVFGSDVVENNVPYSLNWGLEISAWYDSVVSDTLFSNYYLRYLNNLYSLKSRLIKTTLKLPLIELINLKLNDRIIIRDRRYVINQFTTDLDTMEVKIELLQDFRETIPTTIINNTIETTEGLRTYLTLKNDATWSVDSDPDTMVSYITDNNGSVDAYVKENTSGVSRYAVLISDLGDTIIIEQKCLNKYLTPCHTQDLTNPNL